MTGTTIAQALPIAVSPILTRIYEPKDFGLMALFFAITSIFGSIANARYELAIMLPKKDEDAINIVALGIIITTFISTLLMAIIFFYNAELTALLNNKEISFWLYFIPITVFFMGLFNVLNYYNTRKKKYKDIAVATVMKSVTSTLLQLVIGLLKKGATGLIVGQICSHIVANFKLINNIIKDKLLISKISQKSIIRVAKEYQKFPKYSMLGALSNTLAIQLTNIIMSFMYNITTLGFYSLTQKVLGIPATLIGKSINQVFYQKATEEKNNTGKAILILNATTKKLVVIGLPFFAILFLIIEELFAFVYGEEWRIAGQYARIVIPFYFIKFVVSSVSYITSIFGELKFALIWQLLLLFLSVSIYYISYSFSYSFEKVLFIYTVVLSIHYIFLYIVFRRIATNGKII